MTIYAPNTGIPFMDGNELRPSVPFNASARALDAIVQLVVQTTTNTPPTTVAGDVGKRWIVGASPTGAWSGQAGKIALCYAAGLWAFYAPLAGWFARDITAAAWFEYTGSAWAQRDASTDTAAAGDILGLALQWVSATSIRVTTGAAHIEGLGRSLPVTSTITKASLSLTANTWYHVYLFLNGAAADIEIVTTAPATAYRGSARSKTGDTLRRYLGSIRTDGSGNLRAFSMDGLTMRWEADVSATPFRVLAGGTTTAWTSVSLSAVVPVTGRAMSAFIQVVGGTVGTDISSDSAGGRFKYTINPGQFASGMFTFDNAGLAFYYKAPASGAGGLYIDVNGFTFER